MIHEGWFQHHIYRAIVNWSHPFNGTNYKINGDYWITNNEVWNTLLSFEIKAVFFRNFFSFFQDNQIGTKQYVIDFTRKTLKYMINTKLSQQSFCCCHENGLINTISGIPHEKTNLCWLGLAFIVHWRVVLVELYITSQDIVPHLGGNCRPSSF